MEYCVNTGDLQIIQEEGYENRKWANFSLEPVKSFQRISFRVIMIQAKCWNYITQQFACITQSLSTIE